MFMNSGTNDADGSARLSGGLTSGIAVSGPGHIGLDNSGATLQGEASASATLMTDTSSQIFYDVSNANLDLDLLTQGWTDF